jgi:hypothetical protein
MRLQTVDLQDAPESPPNPVTGAEEPSWRTDVTTKLDGLKSAVADITAYLESDRKQRRGSAPAWIAAAVMLVISLVIVFAGIHRGGETSTEAAAASGLEAQAASLSSQLERTLHSKAPQCPGAPASAATLKCEIQAANISPSTYATVVHDERWALLDLSSADRLELEGPTVLAFGSALTGAVLGWMLAQWLGSGRLRARRKSPDPWAGTMSSA